MELSIQNITKSFGSKEVLRDISLTASSGSAFGLLGRNGAGKTTTIRILMNVFGPDSGQILLDGTPMDYQSIQIGYLPEERGLYPKKKILEQLTYLARLKGMDKRSAVASIDHWLDRLGMSEYRAKRLDTLSKGNQQKIQLITALVHDPAILVLDEPFSGLDPVNAQLLKDVVVEEMHRGKVVLFSSHQMNYIEEFCDQIAILRQGTIALSGRLTDIKRAYPRKTLVVRSPQQGEIVARFPQVAHLTEQGDLHIQMDQASEKQAWMETLIQQFDVDEVKVFEPSLSDIFVEYAGDDNEPMPGKEDAK